MNIRLPEKFLPRLIMTVFGVIICAIAVGFFKNSLLRKGLTRGSFQGLLMEYTTWL